MKNTDEVEVFCYKWSVHEPSSTSINIRAFGVDENNNTVFINIRNYTPYCWIELPDDTNWKLERNKLLANSVIEELANLALPENAPIGMDIYYKKKLYFAWKKRIDTEDGIKYKDKLFPFILAKFQSTSHLKSFSYKLTTLESVENSKRKKSVPKPIIMKSLNKKATKFPIHEYQNDNPIIKLLSARQLPSAGWIKAKGKINNNKKSCISRCDIEINCDYKELFPSKKNTIADPCVLSFDIEAYSSVSSAMPNSEKPEDVVFQISAVKCFKGKYTNYLLSLGNPNKEGVENDVELQLYKCEAELLIGFKDLIQKEKINVVIGYNILGWDFMYIIQRCKLYNCLDEFSEIGWMKNEKAPEVGSGFESKAYGTQKLIYLEAEGILFIDLLPVIKRDHKLQNYRLKTVTTHFGLQTKDPLTVEGIFKCWRLKTTESLNIVGRYCLVDSIITLSLYEKLKMWYGLCEMATTAHVPIPYVFAKGTQIQMYSQVVKYCMYNNIVIVSGYITDPNDELRGAIVLQPIAGNYRKVLCFDFASLYPSIIMAYNIDYSTFVIDDNIPDEHCHIFEWEDHVNCQHDMERDRKKNGEFSLAKKKVICGKRRFRFIKKEYGEKGVVPTLLENMLGARKRTRKEIKKNEEDCKDFLKELCAYRKNKDVENLLEKFSSDYKDVYSDIKIDDINTKEDKLQIENIEQFKDKTSHFLELLSYNNILEKRQLAYKICANCFPSDDHEILTEIGFMSLQNMLTHFETNDYIKIGCYVDEELQYHSINRDKIIVQDGSFDMIKFESNETTSICSTYNHRMWIKYEDSYETFTSKEIYDKQNGDFYFKCNFDKGVVKNKTKSHKLLYWLKKCNKEMNEQDLICSKMYIEWCIHNLSQSQLITVFQCFEKNGMTNEIEFNTSCIEYANKIYQLALHAGYSCFIKQSRNKYTVTCSEYTEQITNVRDNCKKYVYTGTVWCVSVPTKSNIICVRRGSKNRAILTKNSMYGAMGVREGYLPLLPAAMSVTYKGRESIQHISKYIPEKFGGKTVYGDTDSAMISFGSDKDHVELTKLADTICEDIAPHFLPPMKLEFEKIYWQFLISEKKRYMARVANKYGEIISFTTKGIILVRRDSCGFAQKIYRECSMFILENVIETDKNVFYQSISDIKNMLHNNKSLKRSEIPFTHEQNEVINKVNNILDIIINGINKLFTRQYSMKDFVVSNALSGMYQNMTLEDYFRTNDVKLLPKNKLPAHVQLGKRMYKRGTLVVAGSRIEYLFTTNLREEKDPNQGDKIEHVDYFVKHNSIYRIDYLYYLQKKGVSPLDDLLEVGIGIKGFVNNLYELHRMKADVCRQLIEMFSVNIVIDDDLSKKKTPKIKTITYNLI